MGRVNTIGACVAAPVIKLVNKLTPGVRTPGDSLSSPNVVCNREIAIHISFYRRLDFDGGVKRLLFPCYKFTMGLEHCSSPLEFS